MEALLDAAAESYRTLDKIFVFDWRGRIHNGLGNALPRHAGALFVGPLTRRAAFLRRNLPGCEAAGECKMDAGAYFGFRQRVRRPSVSPSSRAANAGGAGRTAQGHRFRTVEWRWTPRAQRAAEAAHGAPRQFVASGVSTVLSLADNATIEAATLLDFLRHPEVAPLPWVELFWEPPVQTQKSFEAFTQFRSPEWWRPDGALAPVLTAALEAAAAAAGAPRRAKQPPSQPQAQPPLPAAVACLWAAFLRPTVALQRAAAPLLPSLDAVRQRGGAIVAAHARTGFVDWLGPARLDIPEGDAASLAQERGRQHTAAEADFAAAARGSVPAGWSLLNGFFPRCDPGLASFLGDGAQPDGAALRATGTACVEARTPFFAAAAWEGEGRNCYEEVLARLDDSRSPPQGGTPGLSEDFAFPIQEVPAPGPPSSLVACALHAARALIDARAAVDASAPRRTCADSLAALLSGFRPRSPEMAGALEDLGPCGRGLAGWAGAAAGGGGDSGSEGAVGDADAAAAAALLALEAPSGPDVDPGPVLVFLASDLPALSALAVGTPSLAGKVVTSHGAKQRRRTASFYHRAATGMRYMRSLF